MIDLMQDKKWATYWKAQRLNRILARLAACELTFEAGALPITFALELGWMHGYPRIAIGWWRTKVNGDSHTYFSWTTHCGSRWTTLLGNTTRHGDKCERCLAEDRLYKSAQIRMAMRQMYGDEIMDEREERSAPAPDPIDEEKPQTRPGMGPLSSLQ